MTRLFDTALPPIWYLAFWALGVVALYLAIRFGIAHGLRDAGLMRVTQEVTNARTLSAE